VSRNFSEEEIMPNQQNQNQKPQAGTKSSPTVPNAPKSGQTNQPARAGSTTSTKAPQSDDASESDRRSSHDEGDGDQKMDATGQPADTNVNASHRMHDEIPSRTSIETLVSNRP
jgi:hypothetical protein